MSLLHHVGWCLEPEHMDAAKELWQQLGVDLIDLEPPGLGIRVLLSLEHGIEVFAPNGQGGEQGPTIREFLNRNGEGVYSVALKVDDFDRSVSLMEAAGGKILSRGERDMNDGKTDFHVKGAIFDQLHGMRLAFEEFSPIAGG